MITINETDKNEIHDSNELAAINNAIAEVNEEFQKLYRNNHNNIELERYDPCISYDDDGIPVISLEQEERECTVDDIVSEVRKFYGLS